MYSSFWTKPWTQGLGLSPWHSGLHERHRERTSVSVLLVPAFRKAGSRKLSLNSFRKASVTTYSVVKMGNQIKVLSSEKKRKLHGSLYNKLKLFPLLA